MPASGSESSCIKEIYMSGSSSSTMNSLVAGLGAAAALVVEVVVVVLEVTVGFDEPEDDVADDDDEVVTVVVLLLDATLNVTPCYYCSHLVKPATPPSLIFLPLGSVAIPLESIL